MTYNSRAAYNSWQKSSKEVFYLPEQLVALMLVLGGGKKGQWKGSWIRLLSRIQYNDKKWKCLLDVNDLFDSRASGIKSRLAMTLYFMVLCTFERTFTFHIHYSIPSSHFLSLCKHPQVPSIQLKNGNLPWISSKAAIDHLIAKTYEFLLILIPFSPTFPQIHPALSFPITQKIPQSPLSLVVFTWPLNIGRLPSIHLYSFHYHLSHFHGFDNFPPAHDWDLFWTPKLPSFHKE